MFLHPERFRALSSLLVGWRTHCVQTDAVPGIALQAKGSSEAAARQLTCAQAVADVWPLVEPFLLQDVEHITKHKGVGQTSVARVIGVALNGLCMYFECSKHP